MILTDKGKGKKPTHDRKRAMLVSELAAKYKVTETFVRLVIKRKSQTELAEKIFKEYTQKYLAISNVLKG
jgi:hypothetical protein